MANGKGRRQVWRCECYADYCTMRSHEDPNTFIRCARAKVSFVRYRAKEGQRDIRDYMPDGE